MSEKRLDTGNAPLVHVEAHGRLYLRGWEKDQIRAVGGDDSLVLTETDGGLRAACDETLDLRVPYGASVVVTAFDEATVREIHGTVTIEQIGESLTLRETGAASVKTVGNDLTARTIDGSLTVSQVGRFANVRDINGDLQIGSIGEHANVKNVAGNVQIEAGGNVNLYCDLSGERSVRVESAGVVTCRVAPGLDARVRIETQGPIAVKVAGTRETTQDGSYEGVFGEGTAELVLTADGPVSLSESRTETTPPEFDVDLSFGESLAGLGAGIGEQITAQLGMIEEELEARLSGFSDLVGAFDLTPETSDRIRKRTQEKVEKAQEKIQKAQERAARRIAEAQRRAEAEARRAESIAKRAVRRSWNFNLGDVRKDAQAKSEPVSDEERLMILNMVAEKKISLEEAEALLAALEGK